MSDGVLVVLTNWKRPGNVRACIDAWRVQSIPPASLVVVDNSPPQPGETYPAFAGADDVWRVGRNLGPSCRLAPALQLHGHRYVLFADDDYVPGRLAVAHLLRAASDLGDRFATLGEQGRNFLLALPEGMRYSMQAGVPRVPGVATPCHLTVRGHLVRADLLVCCTAFRDHLDSLGKGHLADRHDDFLLSIGIQRETGLPSYVTPLETNPEERLIRTPLPEPDACHMRPTHLAERRELVDLALAWGWSPVPQSPEAQKAQGRARSPQWRAVRAAWLRGHPSCAACGTTEDLEAHHVRPFHLFPELELEGSNLMTLCEKPAHCCHFRIGHGFDWSRVNPHAREDAAAALARLEEIRKGAA